MNSRILPVVRKELIHIIRDPRSLVIIILMPVLMLIIFGYAFNSDLNDIKLGVLDYSQSQASRQLVEKFVCTEYFTLKKYCQSYDEVRRLIDAGEIQLALIIPRDYAKSILSQFATEVQVLIDGSNSQSATIIHSYVSMILNDVSVLSSSAGFQLPLDVRVNIWYNPELKTVYFFVPGIIAIILMMISALLTCIAIAREKEDGTLEQILVSPIKAREIIVGKVIPYIGLAFLDGLIIILLGMLLFNVPFQGSLLLLLALSLVYIYTALGFGILISTIAPSLRVAMLVTLATTIMPTIILSGFIFPIESMPRLLQFITMIVPARYFLVIARGIILKGVGFPFLWKAVLTLFLMGSLFLMISAKRFKGRLE
jgi:ABC-2 type transport system permease protein